MSNQTAPPTTREEFEAKRLVTVTLADGTRIECRRVTVPDLFARNALPSELLSAWQKLSDLETNTDRLDSVANDTSTVRAGLLKVAAFAAIEPRIVISETRPDPASRALWSELLVLEDLMVIFSQITGGFRPVGAADAESFRGGAPERAPDGAPAGADVQPAAEPVPVGGSTEPDHG